MSFKKPTAKQVAEEAGVSITTISHFLAGRPNACSPDTAERIKAAIEALHYTPNALGKGLRNQLLRTVGICMFDPFDVPYPTESPEFWRNSSVERTWRGILSEAHAADYRLIMYPASVRESAPYTVFLDGSIDGLIFMAGHEDERPNLVANVGFPVVLISRWLNISEHSSCVYADERQAVELAMAHLWTLGHRRIAHISGPVRPFPNVERDQYDQSDVAIARLDAYVDWMRKWGGYDPGLIARGNSWTGGHAAQAVNAWFEFPNRPTAIFCSNDAAARQVIDTARQLGWEVPGQLSVIGVGNVFGSQVTVPPLTTVDLASEAIGREAFRILIARLGSHPANPVQKCMEVGKLIVRSSTGPPPTSSRT
jgi:DNA-binding LacI/PurR family transcriptional regulator